MVGSAAAESVVAFDHRLEPHVRVHHAIAGRTRLRLPPLRGRDDLLGALARRIAARDGVVDVRENAASAALLVEHDPAIGPEAIAALARDLWRGGLTAPAAQATGGAEPWHALPAERACRTLSADNGLTDATARERLESVGENRLPERAPPSILTVIAGQLKSAPVALLAGSAALSLATGGIADAALTLGVIALNTGIGASTERWTTNLIRRLTRQTDPDATVLRKGAELQVPTSRVAPGDWIVLKAGDAVPADARLLRADALMIDESSLTGESFPVAKDHHAILPETIALAERRTMVYRGSVVTNGAGVAVVTATGAATEIGQVRALLDTAQPPQPPMEAALDRLGVRLTIACLGASSALAVMLLLRGQPLMAVARSAIALAVSAIPEGLPALAASTKAMAARAMSREGAYLRNVNVLETAANIDVLCLDKTGTLTQNRMQAAVVQTFGRRYDIEPGRTAAGARLIAKIAALCNDAEPADGQNAHGTGTELALLELAAAAGLDVRALRAAHPRHSALLRSATRLYMATQHGAGDTTLVAVKGAPHQVLDLCATMLSGGRVTPLDDDARAAILVQNESLAQEGLRVLGVARGRNVSLSDRDPADLEWLGLVGLRDPLRPGAGKAVKTLQGAGLRTIILTGDQAGTARRLAEDLGLSRDGALDVVDATQLRSLAPDELTATVRTTEVFARVSAADKLTIIRALQADGHVVAMTGDGVNDGPALRAADVGVAMGKSGADVARDVADIVIADDDLTSLVTALARGRAADENLRRAVRFLLATNASEVALLMAEGVQGPHALETPAQLFWLNLMTDVFPAMGLAMARPAADILQRRPRHAGEAPFGRREMGSIAFDALRIAAPAIITHLIGAARYGHGPRARGLTFLTLATRQLAHALQLRPNRPAKELLDRQIELGVGAGYALLTAPFALPSLRRILRIASPRPLEAAAIIGLSFAPLALQVLNRRAVTDVP
ncbi:HAD-IC family P-type ATPase [Terricaulis sp.]|uniref:HAD-IC family P-type ATPase n=1 Tax=Terricaulis sp. TaxID=2768686 RepID=UPI003783D287